MLESTMGLNTLKPRQNGRHFSDDTSKCIFLNENVLISMKISLKFIPKVPISNIPKLVPIGSFWRNNYMYYVFIFITLCVCRVHRAMCTRSLNIALLCDWLFIFCPINYWIQWGLSMCSRVNKDDGMTIFVVHTRHLHSIGLLPCGVCKWWPHEINTLWSWARFLSPARSKLRLCLANHRAGYFSNLACDWLSTVWAYSEQETENRPRCRIAFI